MWLATIAGLCGVPVAWMEDDMEDDDLETRLWRIIDAEGPPNLPSDIEEAVRRLIEHWRASGKAE